MSRARIAPLVAAVLAVVAAVVLAGCGAGADPEARAAVCADFATQAVAQAAGSTRDADGDGLLCESLPCPCAGPFDGGAGVVGNDADRPGDGPLRTPGDGDERSADPPNCRLVPGVVDIGLSGTAYPEVREHWERAIRRGEPRVLRVRRAGADDRRRRLLAGVPTRPGHDRDEYPPAMARTTVRADVALVDARQNRGAGAVQGVKLRRWCSGQRFRIVWY